MEAIRIDLFDRNIEQHSIVTIFHESKGLPKECDITAKEGVIFPVDHFSFHHFINQLIVFLLINLIFFVQLLNVCSIIKNVFTTVYSLK